MSSSKWMPWVIGGLIGLSIGLVALLVMITQRPAAPAGGEENVTTSVRAPVVEPVEPGRTAEDSVDDRISAGASDAIVTAAQRVSPVVVSINTVRVEDPSTPVEFLAFLQRGGRATAGLGSGVLVDHRGFVLTAHHVVVESDRLNVTLSTGETFAADVIGTSVDYDLALVKIQGDVRGLPVAAFGDSDTLRNGQWAIAIGSPFGHLISDNNPTVTVGVISAVHRDVRLPTQDPNDRRERIMYDMIQTDAAINPGNSGGPLVNANGEVIGINTSIISDAGGRATGVGFAVPINRARWVMDELRRFGRVRRHTLGINGFQIDAGIRQQFGLGDEVPGGWLVKATDPGTPGAEAGITTSDVITHVDGTPIADPRQAARLFFEARVGQELRLTVWRDGRSFDVDVTLAAVEAG